LSPSVNIIIPIYTEKSSFFEKKSIKQCVKIFGNRDITLVAPANLNLQNYLKIHPFKVETFDAEYFSNIQSYNQLLLSPAFYERFSAYSFILIYQSDAFVFRDELEDWCRKNYDFIGAPVPEQAYEILYNEEILKNIHHVPAYIGNGGFSLRKIETFKQITGTFKNDIEFLREHKINEDVIFCILLEKANMKLPGSNEAKYFSIDAFPKATFESMNNHLPFGCHGWFKKDNTYYDDLFWLPLILPVTGYFYKLFFMIKYRCSKR